MPSEEEIGPAGLPCDAYPSDHLAVAADLCITSPPPRFSYVLRGVDDDFWGFWRQFWSPILDAGRDKGLLAYRVKRVGVSDVLVTEIWEGKDDFMSFVRQVRLEHPEEVNRLRTLIRGGSKKVM